MIFNILSLDIKSEPLFLQTTEIFSVHVKQTTLGYYVNVDLLFQFALLILVQSIQRVLMMLENLMLGNAYVR